MNTIPTAKDRYKYLKAEDETNVEYAPIIGYELGALTVPEYMPSDRQTAFYSTGALSWRSLERYARMSYAVFTVITTRLRLLVSAHWSIVPRRNFEDKLKQEMDYYKQLYDEFNEVKTKEAKEITQDALINLHKRLPYLKDDLSNLYNCFDRQRKAIREKRSGDINYLKNFLAKPNVHEDWSTVMTKTVWDYLTFSDGYIFKIPTARRVASGSGKYAQFVSVKAPTITPIEGDHVLSLKGYRQSVVDKISEPVYFKPDEILRFQYLPTNSFLHGLSPIEAIYRLVNEQLYYDKSRVDEFDIGKPPQGILTMENKVNIQGREVAKPPPPEKLTRMEDAINRRSKLDRVKIYPGVGRTQYHNLLRPEAQSRALERQDQILNICARVYNMSQQEVNLISDVNRSTADQQARSEALKGLRPHFQVFENEFYYDLFLPMGFPNYELKFEDEVDESIWAKVTDMLKVMGENEVRRKVGLDEYPEPEFDRPPEYRKEQLLAGQEEGEIDEE